MPALKPIEFIREVLSKPLSTLYVSSSGEVKGLTVDYTVGDVVSANHRSKVKIIDYRTKRVALTREDLEEGFEIANPPGYITLNSITLLKAVKTNVFKVRGEEDLLVLAVAREGVSRIAYGQPNVGVVVFNKDRVYVTNILKTFKPEIIVYHINQR